MDEKKETPQPDLSAKPGESVAEPKGDEQSMLKKFPKKNHKSLAGKIAAAFIVVLAGVVTGWFLSGGAQGKSSSSQASGATVEQSQNEAAIADESTFRDSAEGILEKGGIEGEGTHHLVREGGPTKYVYITSTVIDLESFTGKTVMVWGETITGKQAGWLMDVGKVKVLE